MLTWAVPNPVHLRLSEATAHFKSLSSKSFVLRYDPELNPLEVALFRVACQQQVREIEQLLGRKFRAWWHLAPPLEIVLFGSPAEVSAVRGERVAGFAMLAEWKIAVNLELDWIPLLRHELAHIIGGSWNLQAPTLLCEGLAVWAERTAHRFPADQWARNLSRPMDAAELLFGPCPQPGTVESHRYYILAGSFTGTLIKRFGLPRFKKFYRDPGLMNDIALCHWVHFHVPLETVIAAWVKQLTEQRAVKMLAPRFI